MSSNPQMTKAVILELLNSLGVTISSTTNLPVKDLETRLIETVDKCQYLHRLPDLRDDQGRIRFSKLPIYELERGKLMLDEVRRHSYGEAMANALNASLGISPRVTPQEQPFYDLRQSLMHLGKNWDEGRKKLMFQDKEQTSTVYMRIVDVRRADSKTPGFRVLYVHDPNGEPNRLDWILDSPSHDGFPKIVATVAEQRLLLLFLRENAKRLSSTDKMRREPHEEDFVESFLLPIGPLEPERTDKATEVAEMSIDACAICSKPSTTVCGACQVIRYCGSEHSKQNWRSHKPVCKQISKAHWTTLPFKTSPPPGLFESSISWNRNSPVQLHSPMDTIRHSTGTPPPNAHGSQPFIIKLQVDVQSRSTLLVYDQKRSIQFQVFRHDCPPTLWETLDQTLMAHGLMGGLKLFVWARRKSDWELSLALDRLPESAFPW